MKREGLQISQNNNSKKGRYREVSKRQRDMTVYKKIHVIVSLHRFSTLHVRKTMMYPRV